MAQTAEVSTAYVKQWYIPVLAEQQATEGAAVVVAAAAVVVVVVSAEVAVVAVPVGYLIDGPIIYHNTPIITQTLLSIIIHSVKPL